MSNNRKYYRFFFFATKKQNATIAFHFKLLEIIEYKICLKFLHLFIKSTERKIKKSEET